MPFLEATLIAIGSGGKYQDVPALNGLLPRCVRSPPVVDNAAEKTVRLEFWYDFSSPWAYIGWTQLERIKREAGSSLEVVMVPMLLGALFKT